MPDTGKSKNNMSTYGHKNPCSNGEEITSEELYILLLKSVQIMKEITNKRMDFPSFYKYMCHLEKNLPHQNCFWKYCLSLQVHLVQYRSIEAMNFSVSQILQRLFAITSFAIVK